MKKRLGFLFTAVIVIAVLSTLVSAAAKDVVKIPYNGMNVTRTENSLVVYKDRETTDTNEWGFEVVCDENGEVIMMGGNNSAIPEGGFVLSAHGDSITLLQESIEYGDIIFIDTSSKQVIITEDGVYTSMYSETFTVNAVNSTRLTDYLVIYNKGDTTATNPYGYEASVDADGYVCSLGGNDSAIPQGGFVISGHGTAVETMERYIKTGAKVTFDENAKTITVTFDTDSLVKSAQIIRAAKQALYDGAKSEFRDVMYSEMEIALADMDKRIGELVNISESGDESTSLAKYEQVAKLFDEFDFYNTESRPVELRGLWIRPTEKSPKAVEAVVKYAAANRINAIFIETFFDGTTIAFTRESDIYKQNPSFLGFDVLQSYIDLCHEYGIELHLWATVYQISGDDASPLTVYYQKPEWSNLNKDGSGLSKTSYGDMRFLNPALPEVQDYLVDFYGYLLDTYDIDGLQLDYIRYPNSDDGKDFGYDEYTRGLFEEEYGVDPATLSQGAKYWDEWCLFRCDFVTQFVEKIRELVDDKRPDILLSADVFAEFDDAPYSICQNAKEWIERGLVDAVFPMSYGTDTVLLHTRAATALTGESCLCYMGTAAYMGFPSALVVSQVEITRSEGADGVALFEYLGFVGQKYGSDLIKSAFRTEAVTQANSTAASVYAEYIKKKLADIVVAQGGMTQSDADTVTDLLDKIITLTADGAYAVKDEALGLLDGVVTECEAVNGELDYLKKTIRLSKPAFEATFLPKPGSEKEEEPSEPEPTEEENEPAEDVAADTVETMPGEKTSFPIWIPIVAVAAVAAAVTVLLIIKKKKK